MVINCLCLKAEKNYLVSVKNCKVTIGVKKSLITLSYLKINRLCLNFKKVLHKFKYITGPTAFELSRKLK